MGSGMICISLFRCKSTPPLWTWTTCDCNRWDFHLYREIYNEKYKIVDKMNIEFGNYIQRLKFIFGRFTQR